ncbi:MAG: hypothetical protein VW226_03915 [Rhodospirillaceae bacterium]
MVTTWWLDGFLKTVLDLAFDRLLIEKMSKPRDGLQNGHPPWGKLEIGSRLLNFCGIGINVYHLLGWTHQKLMECGALTGHLAKFNLGTSVKRLMIGAI